MTFRDDRFASDWYAARSRRSRGAETQRTLRRVVAYLRGRRAESWAFFAAGFLIAAILT